MNLRLLRESDLPDLMALKAAANWNQTEADWVMALRFEPEGCFGIEVGGHIVASGAAACYGNELAWIGMVLTMPDHRGKGYARRLMDVAVGYAAERCRVVKLDASDMGRPLYESMGFVAEIATERWMRPAGPPEAAAGTVSRVTWDRAVDTEIFGADRTRLLEEFAQDDAASVPGGYAFARPGSNGPFFGPCVAESKEAGRALMAWFVSQYGNVTAFTDLFPGYPGAEVAAEFGFAPVRRLTRMVLKPVEPALPDPRVYATGSFSWG
jgi:GNAT superfamily N-acetyltransferase